MEYLFEIVVGLGVVVTAVCLIEMNFELKKSNALLRTINEISLVNFYDMVQKELSHVEEIKEDVDDIRTKIYDIDKNILDMINYANFKDRLKNL